MTPPDQSDDSKIDALRKELEALTDEELDRQLSLRISFKDDCPPASRRNYALCQEMAREILESRQQTMKKPGASAEMPSLKALEAAAMMQLANMVKDGDKKPNLEALQITAKLMARKAYRELLAKASKEPT